MHRTDQISVRDAAARFSGVVLLVVVGYLHLLDVSHKVDEGVWYMAFLFTGLIAAAMVIAVGLVRAAPERVRQFWAAAALLAAGALFGYFLSRALPMPQLADHRGDWINLYGVLAGLAELGLIGVAGYAMRDLTLRGVPNRPPPILRLSAAASVNVMFLMAVAPSSALADAGHGETPTEPVAQAGAGDAGSGSGRNASDVMVGGGGAHGDPFLGTAELGLSLAASLFFVWWAARSLMRRAGLVPITEPR